MFAPVCHTIRNNFNIQNKNIKRTNSRYREGNGDVFVRSAKINLTTDLSISKKDRLYKKEICKMIGVKGITPIQLSSIIGPDEFKDVVANNSQNRSFYVTGERPSNKKHLPDSNDIENVKMKIFGASFHVHTTLSDGELSVQEVLDQAVSYADEYTKINNEPFVIGITDHNTVEGCKEAVKIIAQNPDKYKNLRVVLGCEISTKEDELNGYKFKKPEKYHILAMCINPFEKGLNDFLEELKSDSKTPMLVKPITIKDAFDGVKHQEQCYFSLAHPAYPNIRRRIDEYRDPYQVTEEAIAHFKDIVKDRALYAENYYSSYPGNIALDDELHKTIDKACDKLGLYKAGGIDTHGQSIFYNGQRIFIKDRK